jgi:hypothetical protein
MIDTGEIGVLAGLYDRYANAFERTSPDRIQKLKCRKLKC